MTLPTPRQARSMPWPARRRLAQSLGVQPTALEARLERFHRGRAAQALARRRLASKRHADRQPDADITRCSCGAWVNVTLRCGACAALAARG